MGKENVCWPCNCSKLQVNTSIVTAHCATHTVQSTVMLLHIGQGCCDNKDIHNIALRLRSSSDACWAQLGQVYAVPGFIADITTNFQLQQHIGSSYFGLSRNHHNHLNDERTHQSLVSMSAMAGRALGGRPHLQQLPGQGWPNFLVTFQVQLSPRGAQQTELSRRQLRWQLDCQQYSCPADSAYPAFILGSAVSLRVRLSVRWTLCETHRQASVQVC